MDLTTKISDEAFEEVFAYLSPKMLKNASLVCNRF